MENRPFKRCTICTARSYESVCPACLPQVKREAREKAQAKREAQGLDDSEFYLSDLWFRLKEAQLHKAPYCQAIKPDGYPCQSMRQLQVDHKIPRRQGGPDTMANLQTLCDTCHTAKTTRQNGVWNQQGHVIVLCGPPGAGKTTYCKKHWQYGDLIIDIDRLLPAITLDTYRYPPAHVLKYAVALQQAAYRQAQKTYAYAKLWILTAAPARHQRDFFRSTLNADVIVIKPPKSTCIERCKSDPNRKVIDWSPVINDWYTKYRPCPSDTVLETFDI